MVGWQPRPGVRRANHVFSVYCGTSRRLDGHEYVVVSVRQQPSQGWSLMCVEHCHKWSVRWRSML
jgi:hypothetical protein